MALEEVRTCDVFKTHKEVKQYSVLLCEVKELDRNGDPVEQEVINRTLVDLSPRGLRRLQHFIDVGCNTPRPKRSKTMPERIPPEKKAS